MLRQLYIKNFTLIDTLDMRFHPGFSVITGETGAGKSIILGAINLLLGQRADVKSIKSGCDRCVIEAHFDLGGYGMQDFFSENDIDYDEGDCIIRRELAASGKSRAFVNDTPVTLQVMRQLGQQLIDIHSQHQNLLLGEEDFQLNVVDIIAGNGQARDEYGQAFAAYAEAKAAASRLRQSIEKGREQEDYLRFQYNELAEAGLEAGQQEALERESETLSHVEEIKGALFAASGIFSGSDGDGIVERLKEASRIIGGIQDVYPEISETAERIESCYIELKDIAAETDACAESLDYDPKRLEAVTARLDTIYTLQQKHHLSTVEELVQLREDIKAQLDGIDSGDEELERLEKEAARLSALCASRAKVLSETRRKAAATIEKEMLGRLAPLGIPNVRFSVALEEKALCADGGDRVSFLFSANTSTPMMPVSQVASGGEIARVMLSLKAMISGAVKLPTIIFDEIDTGVSGKIAEKMALIMQEMGEGGRQVISITHLPQIAARGASHYKVYKEETAQGTASRMVELGSGERVAEIAQMLSGSDVTEAAIGNAKALLGMMNDK